MPTNRDEEQDIRKHTVEPLPEQAPAPGTYNTASDPSMQPDPKLGPADEARQKKELAKDEPPYDAAGRTSGT